MCDPNADASHTADQWFNAQCFALPTAFAFGSSDRKTVMAPGYAHVDLALGKDVTLTNGARLELRCEVFNLLNRANFDVPNRVFGTPNSGRIFSAGQARQLQIGREDSLLTKLCASGGRRDRRSACHASSPHFLVRTAV
jgi:hypothetical protein